MEIIFDGGDFTRKRNKGSNGRDFEIAAFVSKFSNDRRGVGAGWRNSVFKQNLENVEDGNSERSDKLKIFLLFSFSFK